MAQIGGGWFMAPNSWVRELIAGEKGYPHVPPNFWKFLIILWHEILSYEPGKADWTAVLSMRQFGIRAEDASLWTSALAASNLFTIKKGTYADRNSTVFTYNKNARTLDWQAFYRGLAMACGTLSKRRPTIPDWEETVRGHIQREMKILCAETGATAAAIADNRR